MQRTNEQWVHELQDATNPDAQLAAHQDLNKYLMTVIYNYLLTRRATLDALDDLPETELVELARDFVQDTLLKLIDNDFALLGKYHFQGRFLSWAAKVAINETRQELRKSYWTRRRSMPGQSDDGSEVDSPGVSLTMPSTPPATPEKQAQISQVLAALQRCIESLGEPRRTAFISREMKGLSIRAIAEALDRSANAVSGLVFQAKADLRRCLQLAGFDQDVLSIFDSK